MERCKQCYEFKKLETTLCKECRQHNKSLEEQWPELLFEGYLFDNDPCYVCGCTKAVSTLYSTKDFKSFIPICEQCRVNWNFYGYRILKKINYKVIIKLFLFNLFSAYKVYKRVNRMKMWGEKMKKFMKKDN